MSTKPVHVDKACYLMERYIGTRYDVIKRVYDSLNDLDSLVSGNLSNFTELLNDTIAAKDLAILWAESDSVIPDTINSRSAKYWALQSQAAAEGNLLTEEQIATITANSFHTTSSGSSHSDVVLNTTHRTSDGKNHSDVVLANSHRTNTQNPHGVTKSHIGLANVLNAEQVTKAQVEFILTDDEDKVPSSSAVVEAIADAIEGIPQGGGSGFKLSIAVIGDSLSQAYAFSDTWAGQLQRFTNQMGLNIDVKNWAVAGHTFYLAYTDATVHANGTKTQVQQAIDQGADIVFVCLGINDALYVGGRSQAQIISDGTSVYNLLKAGLPSAQIVLMNEAPHNITGYGLIPQSYVTNANSVPFSHQLITYGGRTSVRANTTSYLATQISASALAKHVVWGNVATALNAIYDGNFIVDLWRLARLGCYVDSLHINSFGHMWIALAALNWLKDYNGVDATILKVRNLVQADNFFNLDAYYTGISNGNPLDYSFAIANYHNHDVNRKKQLWMYSQRNMSAFIGPQTTATAADNVSVAFTGCNPNRAIWYSWDGATMFAINKPTSAEGSFSDTYKMTDLGGGFSLTAGTHTVAYGFALDDGTTEVFETTITYASNVSSTGTPVSVLSYSGVAVLTAASSTSLVSGSGVGLTLYGPVSCTTLTTSGGITANGAVMCYGGLQGTGITAGSYLQSNGTLYVAGATTLQSVLTINSYINCSGIIYGSAGSYGAKISTHEGNAASFAWSGGSFQFYINGSHVKTFVIQHPVQEDKYLVHGTLEGPEGAVYYRGSAQLKNGYAVIDLPDYFEALTREEGRTVLLTNVDGYEPLCVCTTKGKRIVQGRFIVMARSPMSSQEFDWEVKAIRKDVSLLEVEPSKKDTQVYGDGPYTYIRS